MSLASDDESQQNFILALVLGLVAFVVLFVLAIAIYVSSHQRAAAPVTRLAVVTETVSVEIPDGAGIRIGNGVVNFYFATASADIAPGAAEALALVIKGVEAGHKAVISGFHDTTGDAVLNDQLAKKRAEMVRDVLTGLGVPADKVEMRKPVDTTGSGNDAQARRVEVRLDSAP